MADSGQSQNGLMVFGGAGVVFALGGVAMLIMGSPSTFLAICMLVLSLCLFFIAWSKNKRST